MKRYIFVLALSMMVGIIFGQSKTNLNGAIKSIVENLPKTFEKNNAIAVLNVEAPTKELSDYIINEITIGLMNLNQFKIMERKNLELLENELNFNMSGSVSDETAQSIGKYIGVQLIISGTFSNFGDDYRLRIQATSVETAQIVGVRVETVSDDKTLAKLLGDNNPKNAWKNKRFYVGLWPGYGASIFDNADEFKFISYGVFFSYQVIDLFAIGIEGSGAYFIGDYYRGRNDIFLGAVARLTLRPSDFEVDVFIGPAYGTGFAFFGGVQAGYHLGPGVVFVDARLNSWLGYSVGIGYQIGFGDKN